MLSKIKPTAPKGLAKDTREWWERVVKDYPLEGQHIRLLTAACQAWDSGQYAHAQLKKFGTTYINRFGQPCSRPEVAHERDARAAFAKLIAQLNLAVGTP
jgi:phage terminase small subunit